jgi:hypothetical protein
MRLVSRLEADRKSGAIWYVLFRQSPKAVFSWGVGQMALYESEHTKFMREMLAQHPEWLEDQSRGRAIFWDKKTDLDEQQAYREASEPPRPYPYDVNFEQQ